ncbi:MAG: release factor glutamine methyltransferase [Blastocatellia bacterium]|nr:release factor glutamine methyltransferase [Blastocatellia bacterium]
MSNKLPNFSIANALGEGAQRLQEAAVPEARRHAGSLLAHVLGRDRSFLIAHADEAVTEKEFRSFQFLIERRAGGEPMQYITGHQEFFKLDFEVGPAVLIPRPETELIVEAALEILRDEPEPRIVDVGTGSGCLVISLLHQLSAARGLATDVSVPALQVAQRNAQRHGVNDRLALVGSDCFSGLRADGSVDLMVSNPPYVSDEEMNGLQREVRYEPAAALAGGPDGLSVIQRLLLGARPFLHSGGHFVFEIGFGQSEAMEQLIDRHVWKLIEIRKDLQGIPRTFVLQVKE